MDLKKIVFFLCICILSCDNEPVDFEPFEDSSDPPMSTSPFRITEAIGFLNGVEVSREVYTYEEGLITGIRTFANGSEVENMEFVYNGNTFTATDSNTIITFEVEDNNLIAMSYRLNSDPDLNTGYTTDFSNNRLDNYVFFEGTFSGELWYFRQTPVYDGDRILSTNDETMHSNAPGFETVSTTTFNYNNDDQLTGWSLENTEPNTINFPPFDERIEHEVSNGRIMRIIERLLNPITQEFNTSLEIDYTYDNNGNLASSSFNIIGDFTGENHLLDYSFFPGNELQDLDEVRYTYEEGENNNYILLFPEFIVHQTPNPYVRFN